MYSEILFVDKSFITYSLFDAALKTPANIVVAVNADESFAQF